MASHVVVVQGPPITFNPQDPKYKCCCDSCHVTTGSTIVGVVTAMVLFASFITLVGLYANNGASFAATFWPNFLLFLGYGVLHVCLFWGLKTDSSGLLIPYMVSQVLAMIYFGIVFIVAVINVAYTGILMDKVMGHPEEGFVGILLFFMVLLLLLVIVLMGLQIWFFLVIKACFRYFKDKQSHRNAAARGERGYSGSYYKSGGQDSGPPPYSEK